jgi:hypothetical protein
MQYINGRVDANHGLTLQLFTRSREEIIWWISDFDKIQIHFLKSKNSDVLLTSFIFASIVVLVPSAKTNERRQHRLESV